MKTFLTEEGVEVSGDELEHLRPSRKDETMCEPKVIEVRVLHDLIGEIPSAVEVTLDEIKIAFASGASARFYHEQDCCETVEIESVAGDWESLIGHPLLVAEERSHSSDIHCGSETWTFYTFRSVGGTIDARWYGKSNGYYSEYVSVDFRRPLPAHGVA